MHHSMAIAIVFVALPAVAAEPRTHRDLAYAQPKHAKQTLDIYAPGEGENHPIVVWIHGGGWRMGDKAAVQRKPQAFVDKGFLFASINYRLVPEVSIKQMTGDIAKAIHFLHDHAKEYGGDPSNIFVMGHSAGAHLAALICTDDSYLRAEGLSFSILKGCVPVDTAAYDIVKRTANRPLGFEAAAAVFGKSSEEQKAVSPTTFVVKGKPLPPFLILHVADRVESREQSQNFAQTLQSAGVDVAVVPAEGKNHGTINSELGLPGDKPTKALFDFLDKLLNM